MIFLAKLRRIFLTALLFFVALPVASAAGSGGVGVMNAATQAGIKIECPIGSVNCVKSGEATAYSTSGTQTFILKIVGGLLNFVGILAVVMLVVAAIRLVVATGSQDSLQAAKKQIKWIFIALAVIILSLLIVQNVAKIIFKATTPGSVSALENFQNIG
ncbi:MAG: hypothetical protein V1936_03325 [Patescibacteria group bacterium]